MIRVAAAVALLVLATGAAAAQDLENGRSSFKVCEACHAIGDAPDRPIAPRLDGIVGAPVAAVPGYDYSQASIDAAARGLVWTREELAAFLADPRIYLPGTKMNFVGIEDPQRIEDIIAYMATYGETTVTEDNDAKLPAPPSPTRRTR